MNSIISRMVQMNYVDLECVGKNRKAIRLTQSGKKYGELVALPISNLAYKRSRVFHRFFKQICCCNEEGDI